MNLKKMGGKVCLAYLVILISATPIFAQTRTIVVDKPSLQLYVIENADTLFSSHKGHFRKSRHGDVPQSFQLK